MTGARNLFVMVFCRIFMMLETAIWGIRNGFGRTWTTITVSCILKGIASAVRWQIFQTRKIVDNF